MCERHWIVRRLDHQRHEREWHRGDGVIHLLGVLSIEADLFVLPTVPYISPPCLRSVRDVNAFADCVFVWIETRDEAFTDDCNALCTLSVSACEIPPPLQRNAHG